MSDQDFSEQSLSDQTASELAKTRPTPSSSKKISDATLALQDNVRTLLEFKLSLLRSQKECQKIIDEMKALRGNLISAKIKRIE